MKNALRMILTAMLVVALVGGSAGIVAGGSGSVDVTDHGDEHDNCNEGHSNPTDNYDAPVDKPDDCGIVNGAVEL